MELRRELNGPSGVAAGDGRHRRVADCSVRPAGIEVVDSVEKLSAYFEALRLGHAEFLGQQEIVIKALDDYLGDLPGISGGTVLGDGRISMIIDTGSILAGMNENTKTRTIANTEGRSVKDGI